eukprot:GSChrysophyteH1.ASY1.ANO1.1511.1 assembled CDS
MLMFFQVFAFIALCALVPVYSQEGVVDLLSDVTTSLAHTYSLSDDSGEQMACVHVLQASQEDVWGAKYFSLYHAYVGKEYEVRLASSNDLMTWQYRRTLLSNADMPFISRVDGSDWLLVTHEQWMSKNSQIPSQLGFKLYYNESQLLEGEHFNSFVAPLTVGEVIEGTPSIYSTSFVERDGLYMVDADIGFHYNNDDGIDQVASAKLNSFGPATVKPFISESNAQKNYDNLFIKNGAVGNIGQRQAGMLQGQHINVQEANIGSMPPTIWEDWRIWVYNYSNGEGSIPTGDSNEVTMLNIKTHGGSTAFGNPSWTILNCNGRDCLFVSYFLFSEGAADGEAGVCVFVKEL